MKQVQVIENAYFDSATLMAAAQLVKREYALKESVAVMATDANKALLRDVDLLSDDVDGARARDLVLAVRGDADVDAAIASLDSRIRSAAQPVAGGEAQEVGTLGEALKLVPESNLVLISVPGRYAVEEAHQALDEGRHVMIFSDNVSIEDEVALKTKAQENGLLMMGPDCGTAIIGGAPLAFANAVRRGSIGIVAAAGTGLQEVSCLVDYYGGGVSQGIGTGGRDVKDRVGGLQMLQSARALLDDASTEVLVLVSKPPQPQTFARIMDLIRTAAKPVVVCMLGGARDQVETAGGIFAGTLEEAARKAVEASGVVIDVPASCAELPQSIMDAAARMDTKRKYLRALYTGGTLCYEALIQLSDAIDLRSNIALREDLKLEDSFTSAGHTAVDMGEDEFTDGRPHPMIEPSLRAERLAQELEDPEVAVILLDFVLGFGSHHDPVGAMAETIRLHRVDGSGSSPFIIASVTGTAEDPQSIDTQLIQLQELGVHAYRSNAQALDAVRTILAALPADAQSK